MQYFLACALLGPSSTGGCCIFLAANSLYCSREDQGLAEWEDNDPSKDTTIYVTFSPGMSTVSLAKGSP